jgi:cell division septum initiation protein DivIVA
MQWRLEVIADFIFKKLVANRQAIYEEALSMADDLKEYKRTDTREREKIEYNTRTIEKSKRQLEVLVDLCTNGDISVEVFRQKKKKLEDQIKKLEKSNNQYEQQISESGNDALRLERIESLGEFIKMEAFDPRAKIPETLIDAFVDRIIYDKGTFSWYLNPKLGNERFDIDTSTWKKSMLKKTNAGAVSSTGSYR